MVLAISGYVWRLPSQLRQSAAWDRDSKMEQHWQNDHRIQRASLFLRSTASSGGEESVKIQTAVIRQHIPDCTDPRAHLQSGLRKVVLRLNRDPESLGGSQTATNRLNARLRISGASPVAGDAQNNFLFYHIHPQISLFFARKNLLYVT